MRYLVKCGFRIGDVLMCFPALKHLRDQGHEVFGYCNAAFESIFELISYAKFVLGPPFPHDRHISMQVWPERAGEWSRSGKHILEFRYGLNPETQEALGHPIVFDREPEVPDYSLPEGYALVSPFSYSIEKAWMPPLSWYADQVAALTGTAKDLYVLADRAHAPKVDLFPSVTARRLSHLPALIRGARVFITLNSAPSIIASVVRDSYHHIRCRDPRGVANWKTKNQICLNYK